MRSVIEYRCIVHIYIYIVMRTYSWAYASIVRIKTLATRDWWRSLDANHVPSGLFIDCLTANRCHSVAQRIRLQLRLAKISAPFNAPLRAPWKMGYVRDIKRIHDEWLRECIYTTVLLRKPFESIRRARSRESRALSANYKALEEEKTKNVMRTKDGILSRMLRAETNRSQYRGTSLVTLVARLNASVYSRVNYQTMLRALLNNVNSSKLFFYFHCTFLYGRYTMVDSMLNKR